MVFDILQFGSQKVFNAPFARRLETIKTQVMQNYTAATQGNPKPLELPLVEKKWYDKAHVQHIMSKVTRQDGHYLYQSPHPHHLYCHRTDGIIFCPARDYRSGTDFELYKYKQGTMMTIDFLCVPNMDGSVWTGFEGDQGCYVDFSQQVSSP